MKLDFVVHNNTAAVGIIHLRGIFDAPVIAFVIDRDERIPDDEKLEILSRAKCKIFHKELTIKLTKKYKPNDMISDDDLRIWAKIYAHKINLNEIDFKNHDRDFYELACCSGDPNFIFRIIGYLENNIMQHNNGEYYFKCGELLGDKLNGIGYHVQAYCYYEGFFVEKNESRVYELMKKAADLGDESAISWISKENEKQKAESDK